MIHLRKIEGIIHVYFLLDILDSHTISAYDSSKREIVRYFAGLHSDANRIKTAPAVYLNFEFEFRAPIVPH